MNSNERDLIIIDRNYFYDRLSRVLTDYDDGDCGIENLYDMLAEIQNVWEDIITCQVDISDEQEQSLEILNKYPALKSFAERMTEVADDILSKSVAESIEDNRVYEVNIDKYNVPGEPIINAALLDDMLTDSGMIEDSILHEGYIEIMLTEQAARSRFRKCYDANCSPEIEVICAKHALWIYDEHGGEQADFSNCRVENIDFSNTNLCSANLSNALFINCTFKNTSLCDANFSNSKFINCNFTDMVAEGTYQIGTKYINCDLTNAYFTASNFKNAEIKNSELDKASFMNCCLENTVIKGSMLGKANTANVCYDEQEWNEDEGLSMGIING